MVATTLGNTLGAGLLGSIAASMLYGIAVVQTYLYYSNFPKDPSYQKITVAILLLLLSIHTALNIQTVYQYLVLDFGNVFAQATVTLSFKIQSMLNSLIVVLVNSMYVVRVWMLGRNINKIWPAFIALAMVGGWASAINVNVEVWGLKTLFVPPEKQSAFNVSFGYATGFDMMIAFTMCYYLQQGRSSLSSLNNTLLKIMQYVVMCGFLTSACSVSCLITLNTMPNTLVFLGLAVLLPNLYITSYLALLNSRRTRQEKETESINVSKMFVVGGGSRMDQTQLSRITFDERSGANQSMALRDYLKIDVSTSGIFTSSFGELMVDKAYARRA